MIYYLDDFLLVLPPCANLELHSQIFSLLCKEVGLTIKQSKNEEGRVVSFAGIEFDTKHMVIRLPEKKLHKARTMVEHASKRQSLSMLEFQKITGYLNFISTVIPLGRTFLRRLYNMELYFPIGGRHKLRRISGAAKKDLAWWAKVLSLVPERSISNAEHEKIRAWSDAASTKGLGAFYLRENQVQPQPDSAFSIPLPRSLLKGQEHINTQEMRAVEQVLLHWGREWRGKMLVMHIDNKAVVHGLKNRTI